MRNLHRKCQLIRLIDAYNASTAPYVPRTDHEHARHSLRARIAKRLLQRQFKERRDYLPFACLGDYYEGESGRLYPC